MCHKEVHLDNLFARIYLHNGQSKSKHEDGGQVTVKCGDIFSLVSFFIPPFLPSLSPPLPDRLVAYLVWQQQLNAISL